MRSKFWAPPAIFAAPARIRTAPRPIRRAPTPTSTTAARTLHQWSGGRASLELTNVRGYPSLADHSRRECALLDANGELLREEHRRRGLAKALGEQGAPDVLLVRPDRRRDNPSRRQRSRRLTQEVPCQVHVAVLRPHLAH